MIKSSLSKFQIELRTWHVSGLVPETEYEVRVLAATAQGWPTLSDQEMPWSLVKTSSLTEFTPLLPPPSVQLTAINASTIQVPANLSFNSTQTELISNSIWFTYWWVGLLITYNVNAKSAKTLGWQEKIETFKSFTICDSLLITGH